MVAMAPVARIIPNAGGSTGGEELLLKGAHHLGEQRLEGRRSFTFLSPHLHQVRRVGLLSP
jgi:hypothetical protein